MYEVHDIPHTEAPLVLGVNVGRHDSSAALLHNGEILAVGEQERFSRNKRANDEAPHQAIRFCLERANVSVRDLSAVAVGTDFKRLCRFLQLSEQERLALPQLDDPGYFMPPELAQQLTAPVLSVPHHVAHAASAFYVSGFEEAAIIVVDNRGEDAATMIASGTQQGIQVLRELPVHSSLGLYYRAAAQYAGLCGPYREVGKLMGLASYGKPQTPVPLHIVEGVPQFPGLPAIEARGADVAKRRTEQFLEYFAKHCFPFRPELTSEPMAYTNFASSVQASLERAILALAEQARALTGHKRVCLAGGVALNCSANGKLAQAGLFEDMYVQPMAHDSGVGLGAALEVTRMIAGRVPNVRMDHAYYGHGPSEDEIREAIAKSGLAATHFADEESLLRAVAARLARGSIVGWFQGRAEVGPRALGARSILADPRSREALVRVNRVKSREVWRPLAPSVCEEAFSDYFDCQHHSPFMLVAARVKPECQPLLPAITHIDETARPQSVKHATNPRYWQLLRQFERIAGVPVLLNTSFNLAGEPIVNAPEDALRDFVEADFDSLAIGNHLLDR